MIQWLKNNRVKYYDLGAFNPQLNPGVYQFKLGLAGKKEWEEIFLGEFEGFFNWRGHIAKHILDGFKLLRRILKKQNNECSVLYRKEEHSV